MKQDDHSYAHSPDAFCGNAGSEERKHLQWLLDQLNDKEIQELVKGVGITFEEDWRDVPRDVLEGAVDEAGRGIFIESTISY